LSAHDDTEIALILETLENHLSPDLADLRILELACGSGRRRAVSGTSCPAGLASFAGHGS